MRNVFAISLLLIGHALSGQILFDKTYGPVHRFGRSIEPANTNGFMVAAAVDMPWMHTQLMRINASGDTLWTRTFGDDTTQYKTYDMQRTADGGYILCGDYQHLSTSPNMDSYIMKVDSLGHVVWFNKHGIPYDQNGGKDFANGVCELNNGGFVVTGWARHLFTQTNIYNLSLFQGYMSVFDSAGQELRSITPLLYFEPDTVQVYGFYMPVGAAVVGNRIFAGFNYRSQVSTFSAAQITVFNYGLDTLFSHTFTDGSRLEGMCATQDHSVLILTDSLMCKMDTLGNMVWQQQLILNQATAVREFQNGEIVVLEGCSGFGLSVDVSQTDALASWQRTIFHHFTSTGILMYSDTVVYYNTYTGAVDFELTQDSLITFTGASGHRTWIVQLGDSLGMFSVGFEPPVGYGKVDVYPNPAVEFISVTGVRTFFAYEIFQADGKLACAGQGVPENDAAQISIADLAPGIYFLNVRDESGKVYSARFVKK